MKWSSRYVIKLPKRKEKVQQKKKKMGKKKDGTTENLQKLMKDIQYNIKKPRKPKQDKYKHVARDG